MAGAAAVLLVACAKGATSTPVDDDAGTSRGGAGAGAGAQGGGQPASGGGGAGNNVGECTSAVDCDDNDACTSDACTDATCQHTAAVCDDGAFCNGVETCDAVAGCQSGTAPTLDDGIACTMDSCDEDNDVVVNAADHSVCATNDVCVMSSSCSTTSGCQDVPAAVCVDCTTTPYENGAYDLVDGVAATDFRNDGIVDDFQWPGGDFCSFEFFLYSDATLSTELQQARVRIYDLGAGSISTLGNFLLATPVVDQVFDVVDGSLIITDTAVDNFGFDLLSYRIYGSTFSLSAGHYGIHVSFPDWATVTAFWSTAPVAGTTNCSAVWGSVATTIGDNCLQIGPQFERLAFRIFGPT